MKMSQEGTTHGERGESGEKEPKGVNASDTSGERKGKIVDGVGIGKADMKGSQEGAVGRTGMGGHDGRMGEFKGGNKGETVIYSHKRLAHDQD